MKDAFETFAMLAWNGLVIGGTAYLVFWKGHSGWWFALALILLARKSKD